MEIVFKKKSELIFYDTPIITFKSNLPLLIDKNNNVICGNSLRNNYKNDESIKCIIVKSDTFIADTLYYVECVVADENSIERLNDIEHTLKSYLRNETSKTELLTLFDYKVKECITESNFKKPPPYNFEKHKRKKVKDEEEDMSYDDLFSCIGGL